MANKIPRIRSVNIFFYIPQAGIIFLIVSLLYSMEVERYYLLGFCLYLLLSVYLKVLVPKWHRKGVFFLKKGKLPEAILAFERSYRYFKKNPWIDKYRPFTLLSVSSLSYTEMALMNIIYCFERMGDTKNAVKFHEKLKTEFPLNRYA